MLRNAFTILTLVLAIVACTQLAPTGNVVVNTTDNASVNNTTALPHITEPPVTGNASNAGAMLAGDLPVRSQAVDYGPAIGYLVEPNATNQTAGPMYPGVVLIHEWWGLNSEVKRAADALASHGYRVLAVDLYNGTVAQDPQQAQQVMQSVDRTQAVLNMRAAADYLRTTGSDSIGSYGWCFGGAQSLQLALSGEELDATVIYYGQLETDPATLQRIDWPVLGIFGAEDESIPVSDVQAFNESLGRANVTRDVRIYEGVGHAFANPSGQNYAPEQTADAWNRTLAFLNATLKPAS